MYSLGEYNCLLKNKFNIHVILFIYLSQKYKPNFHAKNIIWLQFTVNHSFFKFNYNWRHCSPISLTVVMLWVCTKRVCVRNTELVRIAVWLAFSCHTSAIFFPFIPIPWFQLEIENFFSSCQSLFKKKLKVMIENMYILIKNPWHRG